jgi:trypsin
VVITAAHCTESDYVGVKVGARNWLLDDIYGRKYYGKPIARAIVHPDYKKNERRFYADMLGDLALLVLSGPLPVDAITIKLPNATTVVPSKLDSVGYGTTSEGGSKMSTQLRSVELDSVERSRCNKLLNKLNPKAYNLTDSVVCAGVLAGGKDTCQGDSGGPLFIKGSRPEDDVLVGLTSFGEGCARKNAPAGYTNLKKYEKWIKSELKKLEKLEKIIKTTDVDEHEN